MSQVVDYTGGGGTTITGTNDVPGLDPQIIKANLGMRRLFNKIAPWRMKGTASSAKPESKRLINPSQVNLMQFGDSFAKLVLYNDTDTAPYRGCLYDLRQSSGNGGGSTSVAASSGDYWAANGTTHAWDYEVNPNGAYSHLGVTGTPGYVKYGAGGSVGPGTEQFVYGIIEKNDITARSMMMTLHNYTSCNGTAPSATDTTNDVLTFASSHGLSSGMQLFVNETGGGLTAGTLYYVKVGDELDANTSTKCRLYTDSGLTAIVDLTASITAKVGHGLMINGVSAIINVDLHSGSELTELDAVKAGFCYQRVRINSATGGTFTLSFGGYTTGNIAYNASAATLQTAIEGLHADLSGNVGVSLSGGTYTILIRCNNLSFNWQGITTDATSLTPTTAAYIDYPPRLDVANGATWMSMFGMVGDCRFWPALSFNRYADGVCTLHVGGSGLTLANQITWSPSVAAVVMNDFKPDLCTFHEYVGQAGATLAARTSNLQSFINLTSTAYSSTLTDWIHISYQPNDTVADADVVAANAAAKTIVEADGRMWIDIYSGCPGYSYLTALGWEGDGIHLSYKYNMWAGSIVAKQLGLHEWSGLADGRYVPRYFELFYAGGPRLCWGSGTPEGVVDAPVGSEYVRVDGGALTSRYFKESGTGNTGWVAK